MGPLISLHYSISHQNPIDVQRKNAPKIFAFVNEQVVRLWDSTETLRRFELEDLYDLNECLYDVYEDDDKDLAENKKALQMMLARTNVIDDRPKKEKMHGLIISRRSQMRDAIQSVHSHMIHDILIMKNTLDAQITGQSVMMYKPVFDLWIEKGYFQKDDIYVKVFAKNAFRDYERACNRYIKMQEKRKSPSSVPVASHLSSSSRAIKTNGGNTHFG